ncbi:MAG: restriction endonuclease subunit S [Acidobacteria bacterium]|nr:MAG: restriction endonuclease subunit S [Acidobacteriota bacterium]
MRARQRLVKLLEEYKQALIHQAVTGRIDARTGGPYPEYKDSGVEWLGDVPSHWEVVQLARCIHHIDQGWSPVAAEGGVNEDQWVVLTLSAVRRGRFDPGAFKPIPVNASIPAGIEVCEGDLLITRSNTPDRVGDVCIVKGVRPRTILCDLIYRLRLRNQDLETGYLMRVLLSRVGRDQIERDARGSSGTMPKISQQRMRAWRIALPPLPEQTAIVRFLDEQTASLDRAAQAARREIDLLEELRTRLIADVVTGKLDVREVAARLPEEEDESELLDELEAGAGVGGGAGDLDETPVEAEA